MFHIALRVRVQTHVQPGFRSSRIHFGGNFQITVGDGVIAVARGEKAHQIVGQIVFRIVFQFLGKFGAHLGSRFPFVYRQSRQPQEVVRVGRSRIKRDRALELADGRRHVLGVTIGSPEKHVQRSAVAIRLHHPVENRGGFGFVGRILCLQQAHPQGIGHLHIGFVTGIKLQRTRECVGGFRIFLFLYERARADGVRPGIVGIAG